MSDYQTLQLRCGEAILLEDGSLKIYGQQGRYIGMQADDAKKLMAWVLLNNQAILQEMSQLMTNHVIKEIIISTERELREE